MNAAAGSSQKREPSESDPTVPLSEIDCRDLIRRIATSEHFSKSEFLPKFLLYICDRELRGMTDAITEQQIGVQVFNRPADYNPGDDNIVRNYAGQLRKRLDLYFAREGTNEHIRIKIPRGGYVPVFQMVELPASPIHSQSRDPTSSEESRRGETSDPTTEGEIIVSALPFPRAPDWRMFLLGAGGCALLFCAMLLLFNRIRALFPDGQPATRPLWSEIFARDRDTFIVPADSGLGILQNLSKQPATLADYVSGKYLSEVNIKGIDPENVEDLRTQKYSSIADIDIIAKLNRLPEVVPDRFVVRFARDLRMDDLRDGNAILLGAIHTDPWIFLLQKQLNFQFVCESNVNHCSIFNSHPAKGERQVYENESQQLSHQTFGVVAFIPNLNRTGRILLIEGLNMAATQAAADMLLDEASMRPIIQQATLSNGTVGPFEILIETTSLDATPLPSRIIATRFSH